LPYCQILHAVFRDRGYTLVYAYKDGATTGRFLCFDGLLWQELPRNVVAREVEAVCGTVLDNLIRYVKPRLECEDKEEIEMINKQKAQLKRGRTYISRNSNTNSIVDMYRTQYGDNDIESKLDTNPDILVVRNGVIDLRTGECRSGEPDDYMATGLDTDYNGLESSTKDIDEFMLDIFDKNTDLIEYVQRLLGRAQAGSPSPHLGTMRGARICVKEEAEPKDELNIETIKMISGESPITSRALYAKDYETFQPTALPILICNHKPTINVDDDAMLHRIQVIPFSMIYTTPEDFNRPYDPNNPRHRLRDTNVRRRLLTKCSQEQLLVWLVQGAVKWYAGGLGKLPKCMEDAFGAYCEENDKLGEFIEEGCEQSPSHKVNAGEFRIAFNLYLGSNVQQKVLVEMMKKRGFQYTVAKDEISGSVKVYKGLKLNILAGIKRY
ncbi:hypothetical protein BGX26_003925, partial [Mortierella sp. AD094]